MYDLANKNIAETVVADFNDHQILDHYYFEDSELEIVWWKDREVYLVLYDDKTWDWYSPNCIHFVIEELKESDLKGYLIDVHHYDWDLEQKEKSL